MAIDSSSTSLENHELLIKLEKELSEFRRETTDRLIQLNKDLEKMQNVVYGNGDVGLVGRDAFNARSIEAIRESINARDTVAKILAGVALTLISGLLWGIFTGEVIVQFVGHP